MLSLLGTTEQTVVKPPEKSSLSENLTPLVCHPLLSLPLPWQPGRVGKEEHHSSKYNTHEQERRKRTTQRSAFPLAPTAGRKRQSTPHTPPDRLSHPPPWPAKKGTTASLPHTGGRLLGPFIDGVANSRSRCRVRLQSSEHRREQDPQQEDANPG
jgi:hypothetical protein